MADTTKVKTEFLLEGDIEPITNDEIDELYGTQGSEDNIEPISYNEIDTICGKSDVTGSTITSDDITELFDGGDLSDNETYSSRPVDLPDQKDSEPISDSEIISILNE